MAKKSNRKRTTVEIEGEVVFSNIAKPYKRNDDDDHGLYSITIRIRKDDKEQMKILADAAKTVLGLDKVTPTLMGLTDGEDIMDRSGDPVDPDGYQLRASGGSSDRNRKPSVVDSFNRRIDLTWEPGMSSDGGRARVALALSVSSWEHDVDNGMVKQRVETASYFIRKVMLLDAKPYESDYEFTRFGSYADNADDADDSPELNRFGNDSGNADEEPEF